MERVVIPVERVYWCLGVTEGVDPRNRDVLAMTLLLRRVDPTMTPVADEWDELAEAGARIVASIAREADDAASEKLLLSLAVREARAWLSTRSDVPLPPEAPLRATRRVRVRTAIREA